jgi:uncharacterized protein YaiL (DUF2058 family)
MTDYVIVMTVKYPERAFSISGNDYSTLVMLDGSSKPTKKTLDDAWPQVQADLELKRIQAERAARYQLEADPLFFKAQRDEATMAEWKAVVDQIRADLPYPEVTR